MQKFKAWLKKNTSYSDATIGDVVSRIKRADKILPWNGKPTYLFYLEQEEAFKKLTPSVRSQIRKAIRLYEKFKN